MSFAASQARLVMLIASQFDLELQTQFILQHKLFLSRASGSLMSLKTAIEPGSPKDRLLEAKIHQLNEAEKVLESKLETMRRRVQAVENERKQLSQTIDRNAQTTFGGGRQ